MKRKVRILCFVLLITVIFTTNSFASDYSERIKTDAETFSLDVFFENLLNGDAIIINDNGIDISDTFIDEYYDLIVNKEYNSLTKILSDNNYGAIENIKVSSSKNSIKGIVYPSENYDYRYTEFREIVNTSSPYINKSWTLFCTARFSYTVTWGPTATSISYMSNPVFSYTDNGSAGKAFSMIINRTSYSGLSYNADMSKVSFSNTVCHSLGYSINNFPLSLGPFYTTFYFSLDVSNY